MALIIFIFTSSVVFLLPYSIFGNNRFIKKGLKIKINDDLIYRKIEFKAKSFLYFKNKIKKSVTSLELNIATTSFCISSSYSSLIKFLFLILSKNSVIKGKKFSIIVSKLAFFSKVNKKLKYLIRSPNLLRSSSVSQNSIGFFLIELKKSIL